MRRIVVSSGLALGFLALAGAAVAQVTLRGSQTASSLPAASSATSGSMRTETRATPAHNPNLEPKAMAGILAAQNEARARLGLTSLTWSGALAARADATVKAIGGACTQSAVYKAAKDGNASVYWIAPLRRLGGGAKAQDIGASFIVSEWSAGRGEYDLATAVCRKSGICEQYARMVAPAARAVGCAKVVCASQAQVWACHYDGPQATPAVDPGLRRRIGD
jgi:pathogenesis-related protein 1